MYEINKQNWNNNICRSPKNINRMQIKYVKEEQLSRQIWKSTQKSPFVELFHVYGGTEGESEFLGGKRSKKIEIKFLGRKRETDSNNIFFKKLIRKNGWPAIAG